MFYFPGSLSLEVNLLGGASACRIATESTSLETIPPLQSNLGPFAAVLRLAGVERQNLPLVAWRRNERFIIAIAGLRTNWEAIAYLAGSQNHRAAHPLLGRINGLVATMGNAAADAIALSSVAEGTDYSVFGHSAGGAVAHFLAGMLKRSASNVRASCVTYGAPRFAEDVFSEHNDSLVAARVMNYGDLYPKIVPYTAESPLFAQVSSPSGQSQINLLGQGRNGVAIDVAGNLVPSVVPYGLTSTPTYDYFLSMVGNNLVGTNPHSIVRYEAALLNRSVALPATPLRGPSVDTSMETLPPKQTRGALSSAVFEAQRAAAAVYNSREPASPGVITTRRDAGWWLVQVRGETVYSTLNRRDAKGVAKALRSSYVQFWQRPWQFVEPQALAVALWANPDLNRPPVEVTA